MTKHTSTDDMPVKEIDIADLKPKEAKPKKGNGEEQNKGNGEDSVGDTAPAFSEEHIALEFANMHADELRYVAEWGQWFIWDGTCWRLDKKRKVFSMARKICRTFGNACNDTAKVRRGIASAKTRAAVVSLAGEDHRLAASIKQWDTDPWLLNTPDGVVDLRNGELRPHQLTDYMTKQAAISPGGDCPLWLKIPGQDHRRERRAAKLPAAHIWLLPDRHDA
jgi:phage/plasmid-associated DNA primase